MYVKLPEASREALRRLAARELRDARDQAALLIVRALYRRGLVTQDGTRITYSSKNEGTAGDQTDGPRRSSVSSPPD